MVCVVDSDSVFVPWVVFVNQTSLAERVEAKGGKFLEAPVSGSKGQAAGVSHECATPFLLGVLFRWAGRVQQYNGGCRWMSSSFCVFGCFNRNAASVCTALGSADYMFSTGGPPVLATERSS